MPITRNVDRDVARCRAKVAGYVSIGDEETADFYRRELADARILAAAKEVAARLPDLPPEKLERARAILLGGA